MTTPAQDASYSLSIRSESTSEFIFSQMLAGLPFLANAISWLISDTIAARVVSGLNASASIFSGLA